MNTILSSALLEIVIAMAKHLYAKTINKTKMKKNSSDPHKVHSKQVQKYPTDNFHDCLY